MWGTSCTPIKIFEKLPHENAIKTTPPLIFSQPQVPPSKEFAKKTQGPSPWISNYCASMCPVHELDDKKFQNLSKFR